jgi:hypothetical protein
MTADVPWVESLAAEFHKLFLGLERAHGQYKIAKEQSKTKVAGQAVTVAKPVTDAVWEAHLAGKVGLGVVPIDDDNMCHWGAIDIDVYDLDLPALEQKIIAAGVPLVVCRTKSGGAHLYLFVTEPVPAVKLKSKLLEFTVALGYNKSTEIFPKQEKLGGPHDTGNWINMPYFDGERTTRYCIKDGQSLTPEEFIAYAKEKALDAVGLAKCVPNKPNGKAKPTAQPVIAPAATTVGYSDAPPCLERIIDEGCPEGMRNEVLFSLGVYARLKYGDEWEDALDDLNREIMDPPLKSREVMVIAKSLNKKDYFYRCNQQPLLSLCNKELCKTRACGIGNNADYVYPIDRPVQKNSTNPPTYTIRVHGITIHNLDVETWTDQRLLRRAIYAATNDLLPRMKDPDFEAMINDFSRDMVAVEAPDNASDSGQLFELTKHFCTGKAMANVKEEILMGRPWVNEGFVWFRREDLFAYLKSQGFHAITDAKRFAALKIYGLTSERLHIRGRSPYYLWRLPAFEEDNTPLEVPVPERGAY